MENENNTANEPQVEIDEELIKKTLEAAEKNSEADAEADADEDDAVSEYNDTAAKYTELEEALEDANNKYLRLYAEYDNYRKRTAKEKNETYQNSFSPLSTALNVLLKPNARTGTSKTA